MSKPKIIEATDKFVTVLEYSKLFAENQLVAIKKLAETSEDTLPIARALVKKGWLTKWQASQLLSGFYSLTLGDYKLLDHLGKGDLGNVYLAEDSARGCKVALKTLAKEQAGDEAFVKRFIDDARTAAGLDHSNLARVHEVSSDGQRHFLVMEYVAGRNLQARVDADGQLPFSDVASIVRQAAEGLHYAHEQGVVHRDIKPANVMVDDQGVAKILDLGVGYLRRSDSTSSENTAELTLSSIAYTSPEHARGQEVDARSDIYSLGGVLYFLLTGRAPFTAKTDAERAKVRESKRPVPISELRSDAPPALVDVCRKMMSLNADDRFPSMAAVLAELNGQDAATTNVSEDTSLANAEVETVVDELEETKTQPPPVAGGVKIDLGDAAKLASGVSASEFSINTKRRKKKKKPEAEPEATPEPEPVSEPEPEPVAEAVSEKPVERTVTATEEETSEQSPASDEQPAPADTEPKKGLPKALIFAGAGAAALLLLVGVGVGSVLLFGRGDTVIVQAPQSESEATSDVSGDAPAADAFDTETTSEESATDESTSEEPATPAADGSASPDVEPPADSAASPAATGAEPDSEPSEVVAAEPATSTDATKAAAAMPDKTNPTATAPAPTETASATPDPKPAAAEKKPTEKKPPETKPAAKKKEPPKEKAPPKPKTFVFKPAIELPIPAADAPEVTLGQVNIGAEDNVFISLDGGDIAATGKSEFSLQNAQDGVAPRDWEFYLEEGTSDPIVVATMSMPEKDLKFKWTAAGIASKTATNLRNCSLKITAGQSDPQDLALRIPQPVGGPFLIDLERAATIKLPLEGAPDRSSLKLAVTVKGHKHLVEPAEIALGRGGRAMIFFGENEEQSALALKLDISLNARGVQVKTVPYFIVPGENAPIPMNKGSIKKYEARQSQQAGLQNQVLEGEKAVKNKNLPPQQKARFQVILAEYKRELEIVSKISEKMAQLRTDTKAVGAGASLQFRVFCDTFDKQIDLIVTDPKAAPVAP